MKVSDVHDKCKKVFEEKNAKYGNSFNQVSGLSCYKTLELGILIGLYHRMLDKIARIKEQLNAELSDRRCMADAYEDLCNYAAMSRSELLDVEPSGLKLYTPREIFKAEMELMKNAGLYERCDSGDGCCCGNNGCGAVECHNVDCNCEHKPNKRTAPRKKNRRKG